MQGALPSIPFDVVLQHILPYTIRERKHILRTLLVSRRVPPYAYRTKSFWEPYFLAYLQRDVAPYHHFMYAHYVMWPEFMLAEHGIMGVVRSKQWVASRETGYENAYKNDGSGFQCHVAYNAFDDVPNILMLSCGHRDRLEIVPSFGARMYRRSGYSDGGEWYMRYEFDNGVSFLVLDLVADPFWASISEMRLPNGVLVDRVSFEQEEEYVWWFCRTDNGEAVDTHRYNALTRVLEAAVFELH